MVVLLRSNPPYQEQARVLIKSRVLINYVFLSGPALDQRVLILTTFSHRLFAPRNDPGHPNITPNVQNMISNVQFSINWR